jgi:hypothetical protein
MAVLAQHRLSCHPLRPHWGLAMSPGTPPHQCRQPPVQGVLAQGEDLEKRAVGAHRGLVPEAFATTGRREQCRLGGHHPLHLGDGRRRVGVHHRVGGSPWSSAAGAGLPRLAEPAGVPPAGLPPRPPPWGRRPEVRHEPWPKRGRRRPPVGLGARRRPWRGAPGQHAPARGPAPAAARDGRSTTAAAVHASQGGWPDGPHREVVRGPEAAPRARPLRREPYGAAGRCAALRTRWSAWCCPWHEDPAGLGDGAAGWQDTPRLWPSRERVY